MASLSSGSVSHNSSLRRINDDSRLRPFLSPLFDSQSYIRTVIKEGKSEECFQTIVRCVDDVNVEIKGYISQHKDELMSGMQDVATLADRYVNLSAKSQKLHKNISRLKSEATESHSLVANRTNELERIHATSILLHQLKQFVHARASLEAYTQKPDETDLRNLSGAAKTISDMEKLLRNPALLEIKCVSEYAGTVRTFGASVRLLAQERLLAAIVDKNQAAMANSLQVFYNMDSLPEILLLVVDSTVKRTVESSRAALDVESIHALLHDGAAHTAGSAAGLSAAPAGSVVPMSASKKPLHSAAAGATGGAAGAAQLRTAIREVAHVWSSMVHEMALQIHALQRVVAKKEDPATHQKFLAVLHRVRRLQDQQPASGSTAVSADLLSKGLLLELFWHRLAESLQDVAADKVKHFGAASSRAYPFLRKAALDTLGSLRNWSEHGGNGGGGGGYDARAGSGPADLLKLDFATEAAEDEDTDGGDSSARPAGMFGSLLWTPNDLLAGAGGGRSARLISSGPRSGDEPKSADLAGLGPPNSELNSSPQEAKEHSLVQGLRPMRDKYLMLALQRMSAPIAQMFPELEGYTAAVPSKRDLLALTKAIQAEFSTASAEGDASLVALLCREFLKTVRLMLSKIEGMVTHSADTRTIFSANNFARSQGQLHNANLLALLVQFKEALQKIPGQVQAAGADSAVSLLDSNSRDGRTGGVGEALASAAASAPGLRALEAAVATTSRLIEDLAARQIMDPVVALLSSYVTSLAVAVQKEGVVAATAPSPGPVQSPAGASAAGNPGGYTGKAPVAANTPLDASAQDCSVAVQSLLRNIPALLKSHVLSLPKCDAVTRAVEEIYVRTLHSYVTVAALSRPVTEGSRLRTAKDLAALEMMLSGLHTLAQPAACPVLRECRAFRRLLFEQDNRSGQSAPGVPATPAGKGLPAVVNPVPDARDLLRLPYIASLRPSTLLGYLVSCAPPQLPLPFEVMARPAAAAATATTATESPLVSYVDMLVDVHLTARGKTPSQPQGAAVEGSVRGLYADGGQGWSRIANEAQSWELVQHALDTFFQRIAVADGEQRQVMRQWYEAIMDVGSKVL